MCTYKHSHLVRKYECVQFLKVMDYFMLGMICTIHICMYIEHNSVNVFAQETLRIFLLTEYAELLLQSQTW